MGYNNGLNKNLLSQIKEIYCDFQKAMERLSEALQEEALNKSIVVDGTIQRFEFTFELSWKLAKAILKYNGVKVETPRMIIKEAYQMGMIKNGEDWIGMLEDRNKASCIYDEKQAQTIYDKIKKTHYKNLNEFKDSALKFNV